MDPILYPLFFGIGCLIGIPIGRILAIVTVISYKAISKHVCRKEREQVFRGVRTGGPLHGCMYDPIAMPFELYMIGKKK